jgi:hypothetical protein
MSNQPIDDEVSFLYHAAYSCRESRTGYDGAWQIAPFQCSIPYEKSCLERLCGLKNHLRCSLPKLIEFGELRAQKAFVQTTDTITKPSYIKRIYNFLDGGTNQVDALANIASREPASGGLVFSVFSPRDLVQRQRPGYVPCLISGSFLLHEDALQLNAFFRSQSVIEFGLFDLIFLRSFQVDFVDRFNSLSRRKRAAVPGSLNLHFGRILIHRRLIKSDKRFVSRTELVDRWIALVEQYMMSLRRMSWGSS